MSQFSKKLALVCALGGLSLSLTGCHGSKGLPEFAVPEEFDTSRNYEITSGRKTIPTRPRQKSTKKPLQILKPCIPISR
jgi:hypothetical protein